MNAKICMYIYIYIYIILYYIIYIFYIYIYIYHKLETFSVKFMQNLSMFLLIQMKFCETESKYIKKNKECIWKTKYC